MHLSAISGRGNVDLAQKPQAMTPSAVSLLMKKSPGEVLCPQQHLLTQVFLENFEALPRATSLSPSTLAICSWLPSTNDMVMLASLAVGLAMATPVSMPLEVFRTDTAQGIRVR